MAFIHGRNGWPPFLDLSCSAASCRTYGKHSLPVRHSTGPGQGEGELDSVRTTAGAPPSTSWKSAQCSGSQCAFFPFVSRHTNQLLRPVYTIESFNNEVVGRNGTTCRDTYATLRQLAVRSHDCATIFRYMSCSYVDFMGSILNTCRITSSVPGWTWATRRRVPFVYCAWTRSRVFTDAPPARQNCMLDTPPPPPPAPRSSCIPPTLPLFLYRRSARVWVGSCAMGSLVEHNRGAIGDSLAPRESGTTLSPPAGVSAEVEVV